MYVLDGFWVLFQFNFKLPFSKQDRLDYVNRGVPCVG